VVDDHQILRDALMCRLHNETDFEVVGLAATSEEAYACVEKTGPNLVIMDLHHPGDNGLIATAKIRQSNPQIKILILTGDSRVATAHEALLAGANGFLRKADSGDELVRAVRVAMSGEIYHRPETATAVMETLAANSATSREPALNKRELSVLKWIADGLSYKEIADQLCVSAKSVEYYRARLVKKTGFTTRAELVRYAVRIGIVAA
jgi:two-component system response regulator NreC